MSRRVRFRNDGPTYKKPLPTEIHEPPHRTFKVTIERIDPIKVLRNRSIARQCRYPMVSFSNSRENCIKAEFVALQRAISLRAKFIIQRQVFINGPLYENGQDLSNMVNTLTKKIKEVSYDVYYHQENLQNLNVFI